MIRIPLDQVPTQTLAITLAGQAAQIALRQNGGDMYFDLLLGVVPIVTTKICRDRQRLLVGSGYRGFLGDFMFVDTRGNMQPFYLGLDDRYLLVYLESGE